MNANTLKSIEEINIHHPYNKQIVINIKKKKICI